MKFLGRFDKHHDDTGNNKRHQQQLQHDLEVLSLDFDVFVESEPTGVAATAAAQAPLDASQHCQFDVEVDDGKIESSHVK